MDMKTGRIINSETSARSPGSPVKKRRRRKNLAGRPTATELDRRKVLVLDVATELFVDRGYAATTLVDIARGAGVATRTLYQHFGDKEAIFSEVIFARDEGEALDYPSVEPGDTLFAALERAGRYTYQVTYREKSIGLMRLMIAESNRFPEFMKNVAISIFERFRRNIEKVFEGLEASGLIPAGNHARSAELFSDLVLGSHPIMTYTSWDAAPPTEQDLKERVALFILGRFGSSLAKTARTRKATASSNT
jgi:TetR/AcrR family transcriptional regulator, mexJK operon transcriptional repressor